MRVFLKCLAIILVICILAGIILFFLARSRLPDVVANKLSKTLQVAVEIGDINVGLNTVTVDNFEINNPRGFKLEHALTTQKIIVQAPLMNYAKNDIVIEEITMNNVYIGFEFESIKGTSGNWTMIMNNAKSSRAQSSKSASEKSVLIKRLVLNTINADLLYQSDGNIRHLPMIPQIVLVNISSKGGDLTDQLMNSALGQMLKEIFTQENLKHMMDKILEPLPEEDNPVNNALKPLKGLFD